MLSNYLGQIMCVDRYFLFVSCMLGLVEGLTEFLPISSTLHIVFVGNLLGLGDFDKKMLFLLSVVLQLGAIFSVVVVFWSHFLILIKQMFFCIGMRCFSVDRSCLSCTHIVLGILPTVILGAYFYENIKNLFSIHYMIYALICGSFLLLLSEWFSCKFYSNNISNINDLSYLQAFLIGCFQCLALFPGFSRSGATISGGLLVGASRSVSSVFSFLLAVPIMFGAVVLVLYKSLYVVVSWNSVFVFIVGAFSAFIVSLCTIKIFMKCIQYVSFIPFVIYRFVLAFLIYCFNL